MNRSKSIIAVLAAVVVAGLGSGGAQSGAEPPWLEALNARSEALNERYGIGSPAPRASAAEQPGWLRALGIRSDALNREYKLGAYAPDA